MAVTIVDRRLTVDQADTTTGWTNAGFGTTTTDVAEAGAAVADGLNIAAGPIYFTSGAAADVSDSLIYVYSFNNALQNSWDTTIPPNALLIGDGTNRIAFHQAGQNRRVFNHADGPTNWQCFLLDGSQASVQNTAGLTFADAGTFASLNLNAITQWGSYFETLSKALGGGYNVAVDIIRWGNDGIYVLGGGVGTEGTCLELAAADRSTLDGAAHGIFRELNPSSFGVQGPITFGRNDIATDSYFEDSGISIAYEDRYVSDGKYYFDVTGHPAATNYFKLSNATLTTAAQNLSVSCSNDINTLVFDGVSFVNLRNTIHLPTSASATATASFENCSVTNAREIFPGITDFVGNTISNYSGSGAASGSVIINTESNVSNWSDLTFNSLGTGHAIYFDTDATGSFSFTGHSYNGYAAVDGSTGNEVVWNNSGGAVTINVSSGQTPTVRNGTGATTTVNNNVSITLTGMVDNTEVRVYQNNSGFPQTELAGVENATDGTTNDRSFTFSLGAGTIVDIVIHAVSYESQRINALTIPSSDSSIPIQQRFDRNYLNP